MTEEPAVLEVYQTGPLTVVGFGGRQLIHDISIAPVHDEILKLVQDNACQDLAFDLTGVRFIPSGLLGILASLRKRDVQVHVYNPSDDVRDVLETTGLNKLIQLHEVD
ncbi:MAG: STAS domain-containing protein, partial [Planctomycetaceae bacterium]